MNVGKIDQIIKQYGDSFIEETDNCTLSYHKGMVTLLEDGYMDVNHICTVAEYKERLHKQELIKLIESACTDDAASIANVIIRNGWVKK